MEILEALFDINGDGCTDAMEAYFLYQMVMEDEDEDEDEED